MIFDFVVPLLSSTFGDTERIGNGLVVDLNIARFSRADPRSSFVKWAIVQLGADRMSMGSFNRIQVQRSLVKVGVQYALN